MHEGLFGGMECDEKMNYEGLVSWKTEATLMITGFTII